MATLVVDNSTLSAVATCTTKALMEYSFHYRQKEAKVEAECGKGGHKALAKWFAGYSKQDSIQEFLNHYRAISEEFVPTDSGWDWSNVKEIIEHWMDTHPIERFSFEILVDHIESGLKVPLTDGVEFFALIDVPVDMYFCQSGNPDNDEIQVIVDAYGHVDENWSINSFTHPDCIMAGATASYRGEDNNDNIVYDWCDL